MVDSLSGETLKALIESAFSDAPYPGDDKIVNVEHLRDRDIRETQENFRGRHWRDVSLERLDLNRDSIWCFTPEAFRFYLPAFMIGLINWDKEAEGRYIILIYLRDILTPPFTFPYLGIGPTNESTEGLTPQQKTVVQAFREYIKDEYDDDLGPMQVE